MKELKKELIFLTLLIIFTISALFSTLTVTFQSNQFGYSLLLLTLPINYEKQININTKVYFLEMCQLNSEFCKNTYFILQSFILLSILAFYLSLLFYKRFSLYLGIVYVSLSTAISIYSLINSEKHTYGIFLNFFNSIIASVLIYIIQKRVSIEKNIVIYDVIHGSINSIPESERNNKKEFEENFANESNLDISDLVGKLGKSKDKYKKAKLINEDKQKIINELKNSLREQKILCKDLERKIKEKDNKGEADRGCKEVESENIEYEVLNEDG